MESEKGQGEYSTKLEGARALSEAQQQEPPAHQEQRIYTREFKVEAVRLSESSDKTVAQIARDLGVPERVLYRWRHELREQQTYHEQAFPGKGRPSEVEEETRRLKRELELLKQEREILKKRSASSHAASHEVCLHRQPYGRVRRLGDVPCAGGVGERLRRLALPHQSWPQRS